jgi:hypothetical protein
MGRINKTISLNEEYHTVTRDMPNFSGFVEYCLHAYVNEELEVDWDKIKMRDMSRAKLEIQSRFEKRLDRIEQMLNELTSRD